jgi:hypothetical protein
VTGVARDTHDCECCIVRRDELAQFCTVNAGSRDNNEREQRSQQVLIPLLKSNDRALENGRWRSKELNSLRTSASRDRRTIDVVQGSPKLLSNAFPLLKRIGADRNSRMTDLELT